MESIVEEIYITEDEPETDLGSQSPNDFNLHSHNWQLHPNVDKVDILFSGGKLQNLTVEEVEVNTAHVDLDSQDDIPRATTTTDRKCNERTRNRKRELNGNGFEILDSVTYTKYQFLLNAVYDYFGNCGLECNLCESLITQLRLHITEAHGSHGISEVEWSSGISEVESHSDDSDHTGSGAEMIINSQSTDVFRILDVVTYTKYQSLLDTVYDLFGDCSLECGLCESLIIQLRLHISDAHESHGGSGSESLSDDSDHEPNPETNCSADDDTSGLSANDSLANPIPTPAHRNNFSTKACEAELTTNQPNQGSPKKNRAAHPTKKKVQTVGPNKLAAKTSRVHRQYSCEACSKKFTRSSSLRRHILAHTGKKRHSCQICHKSFRDKLDLKIHVMIHTGEKPHSCEICGKSFRAKSTLRTHVTIHTQEKPHSCETCGKSFRIKASLQTHVMIHTGEKPYLCETCGRSFRGRSSFRCHSLTHTRDNRGIARM